MVKSKIFKTFLLWFGISTFTLLPTSVFSQGITDIEDIRNLVIDENCPPGMLYEPEMGYCAEIRDMRSSFQPTIPEVAGRHLPNLLDIRLLRSKGGLPIPNGAEAGTLYRQNMLQALRDARLYTKMFVYPNGIGSIGNEWIFTTATNRTERSVEVVGIYTGSGTGDLGIFDWSCMPGYPCPNGSTGASWQWTRPFSQFSCYYTMKDDGGGHPHNLMYYINSSNKGEGDPPVWGNSVFLWNYCRNTWDAVYSHTFRVNQRDCSMERCFVDNYDTGWWGPIVETTMGGPQPQIKELGFWQSWLYHDGVWSTLGTNDTTWATLNSSWLEFHRDPNRSYGVGNFTNN